MGVNVNELESSCQALSLLFTDLMISTKDGIPVFEDLINKSTKLSSSLRSTVIQLQQFLETFQKVADFATNSKGATKEIGKSLTRLCLRHRSIEQKLRSFGSSFMEELSTPMTGMIDEWKQKSATLEKDRAKDTKRARQDIKRASSDTLRLQKKAKKGKTEYCKSDIMEKLDSAMQGVSEKYIKLEECEKSYVRSALIDERKRYCDFICCLRPVIDREVSMINEIQHLTEIIDHLSSLCADPESLPEASEQVINDLKGTNFSFRPKTPPDSPTSDRHSIASSVNSLVSGQDMESNRSSSPGRINTLTMKSTNSADGSYLTQDSAYTSHEALYSRSQTHMPYTARKQRSHGSLEEEKSDSLSVYSSMSHSSHGSNDYDSMSLQSGSTHNVSIPAASRPHTISGSSSTRNSRSSLTNETYQPPNLSNSSNSIQDSNAMALMPPPPRPERMSSVPEDTPLTDQRRNSARSMSTRTLPNKNRSKSKPVALPSVPFMNSEPIYMNTAQLAEQIAAQKRRSDEVERASIRSSDSQDMNQTLKNPVTQADEIRAQNDALADAIKELEATTAALDECIEEGVTTTDKRQSVVSTATSDYCTATSNSSASEETIHITTDAPDSSTAIISETDANLTTAGGLEVSTPYGNATLRRNNGVKPPPPIRRNSQITSAPSRSNSTRSSKPPVISPKPKINSDRASRTSESSRSSDSFPPPPTPIDLRNDDDPYAIPMNCQPIEVGALPPPPPEFGHDSPMFSITDLPPPIPDTPPQFHNTHATPSSNNTPVNSTQPNNVAQQNNNVQQNDTNSLPPWQKPNEKPKKQPPPVAAKKGKLNNDFISQLNAKLGNSVSSSTEQKPTNDGTCQPSTQVQALASQKNTNASRNNLLSQIQSGARLKRTEIVNDRSAPRL